MSHSLDHFYSVEKIEVTNTEKVKKKTVDN
jgi:hypothetical protein